MTDITAKLVPIVAAALRNIGVNLHGNEPHQVAAVIAVFVEDEIAASASAVSAAYEAAPAETPAPPDSSGEPANQA